ncbi:G-protein-signaling modulator 2 [Taenia solium]
MPSNSTLFNLEVQSIPAIFHSAPTSRVSQIEGRGMTFKEVSRKPSNPRTCLELALEAERVCKTTRDYQTAIRLFRQALAVGTDDITVLSAIYSQLGNAYFYEHDFLHALEFHRWDLSLSRRLDDTGREYQKIKH